MNLCNPKRRLVPWARTSLAILSLGFLLSASAAITTNVSIGDNFFSPTNLSINLNDSVQWNWNGFLMHSSTGPGTPALWDTGLHTHGFSFTLQFTSGGTFPYRCTLHAQTGTVFVASQNVPPTVALTSPTNGATFAAPWTGTIQASAADSDGTVAKVDFFAGANKLGTVSNPPPSLSLSVSNLAAGDYTLTAVATDNSGAANTSAGVLIHLLAPSPILLSSPHWTAPASFQFSYTATPGLSYVVQRSSILPNFVPLRTNVAENTPVVFVDTAASGPVNFYSVKLLPNP